MTGCGSGCEVVKGEISICHESLERFESDLIYLKIILEMVDDNI